jgi:hypothetical protein
MPTDINQSELINMALPQDHEIEKHPGTDHAPMIRLATYGYSQAQEMLITCLGIVLAGSEALPFPLPPPLVSGRLKLLALLDLESMFMV